MIVTEYVVVEAVNGFSKPADRPKAHFLADHIRSAQQWEFLQASADLFDAGLQLHRSRDDKEWSLTDCISFVVMEQRGIRQALTYDHHFEQAGYEALLRRNKPK